MTQAWLLAGVALVALGVLAWQIGEPFYHARRRRRLLARPIPAAWEQILRRRMPLYRRLPGELQAQLLRHMQVFLAEKQFVGCNGVVVTDAMRITIAAQACLLLLNRRTDYYPNVRQLLIYPSAFIVDKHLTDAAGVASHERQILAGESWSQGQVILSWEDAREGAAYADGYNVVIHEFAHQLDLETGDANGAPRLGGAEQYARWSTVLGEAYAQLQRRAHTGEPALLDYYGASDPAEFFAVASEVFFEQPADLADDAPALYNELRDFYRVDPLTW